MALIGKKDKRKKGSEAELSEASSVGKNGKRPEKKAKRVAKPARSKNVRTATTKNSNGAYRLFGKPIVGDLLAIDLEDDLIRVAVAKLKKNTIVVQEVYEKRIDSGLVVDGDIMEEEAVYQLMRQWFQEEHIDAKYAFFSVERTDTIRRQLTVSTDVAPKDVEGLVAFELAQYLDIDISSYIVQYQEIGLEENELGEAMLKLMVYAMPKAIAEKRFNLAKNLKLIPYSLDIRSNTLQKWVNDVSAINEEPLVLRNSNIGLIYIDSAGIYISLYASGQFSTGQSVREGLKQLDDKIATTNNVSIEQAANIRREYYGELDRNPYGANVDESLHSVVNHWVEKWHENIRDTEDYFRRTDSGAVDTYYIYGLQGELEKAVPYLESRLKKPIVSIQSFDGTLLQWEVDGKQAIPGALLNTLAMLYRRG